MIDLPDIASAAALLADPVRAVMLNALLNRSPLSAGQLAFAANVSPQTASFHLAKLTSGALLVSERQGRRHIYRLADPAVASAIESLAAMSTAVDVGRDRLRGSGSLRMQQLRAARTCYDHLAGALGVDLHDALLAHGYVAPRSSSEYVVTSAGREWLDDLGIETADARTRSPYVRPCLDWSEQRPHLAGRVAAHLLRHFLAERWLVRCDETRAVRVTQVGAREFQRRCDIRVSPYLRDRRHAPARSPSSADPFATYTTQSTHVRGENGDDEC